MSSADKHSLMSSFPICVHLLPLTVSSKNFQYNVEKIVNPSVVLHRVLRNQRTTTLYTCFQMWQFFKHPRPMIFIIGLVVLWQFLSCHAVEISGRMQEPEKRASRFSQNSCIFSHYCGEQDPPPALFLSSLYCLIIFLSSVVFQNPSSNLAFLPLILISLFPVPKFFMFYSRSDSWGYLQRPLILLATA